MQQSPKKTNIMAKFTLFFKDKLLQTYAFANGVIYIGRDTTNNITIDSLAVAPIHAVVDIRTTDCIIKQVSNDFPIVVNDKPGHEHLLNNSDRISIGKHSILYTVQSIDEQSAFFKNELSEDKSHAQTDIRDANLQVMDGKHIGRIIPIKKAITRMGRSGEGVVIITKRKEGYFISALESNINLTINHKTLDDQIIKLSHEDLITIDNIAMQFFLV